MALFPEHSLSYDDYIHTFPQSHVEAISEFADWLATYEGINVCNPWSQFDESLDMGANAPMLRRQNFIAYMLPRLGKAKLFVVAEAVGYQGGRFSGIAITCERMLLGHHKTIRPTDVADIDLPRTSSATSELLKGTQQKLGFNEPTDTVVWNAIVEQHINPYDVVLWNIFPFHPHKESAPLTNRTPTEEEQRIGYEYTNRLLDIHKSLGGSEPLLLAVGQKSADTLQRFGIDAIGLRHPANGGANLYRDGFAQAVRELM